MKLRASYVNVSKKKTAGSKNKKSAKKKLKRNEKSVDLKKKNENKIGNQEMECGRKSDKDEHTSKA